MFAGLTRRPWPGDPHEAMRRWLAACLLLLSACSAGPENFWRGFTRGLCKFNRKCADSELSVSECEQRSYQEDETPEQFAETCPDFSSEAARACLRYLRDGRKGCAGLSEWPASCEGVCGPGSALGFEFEDDEPYLIPVLIPANLDTLVAE